MGRERGNYPPPFLGATSLIGAVPAGGRKKGADRGIDGFVNFRDAEKKPVFAIVSVKGGEKVSAPMIRDLSRG